MITITFKILASGETVSRAFPRDAIQMRDYRAFVLVWPDHYAELSLEHPEGGWIVYPD